MGKSTGPMIMELQEALGAGVAPWERVFPEVQAWDESLLEPQSSRVTARWQSSPRYRPGSTLISLVRGRFIEPLTEVLCGLLSPLRLRSLAVALLPSVGHNVTMTFLSHRIRRIQTRSISV